MTSEDRETTLFSPTIQLQETGYKCVGFCFKHRPATLARAQGTLQLPAQKRAWSPCSLRGSLFEHCTYFQTLMRGIGSCTRHQLMVYRACSCP